VLGDWVNYRAGKGAPMDTEPRTLSMMPSSSPLETYLGASINDTAVAKRGKGAQARLPHWRGKGDSEARDPPWSRQPSPRLFNIARRYTAKGALACQDLFEEGKTVGASAGCGGVRPAMQHPA